MKYLLNLNNRPLCQTLLNAFSKVGAIFRLGGHECFGTPITEVFIVYFTFFLCKYVVEKCS